MKLQVFLNLLGKRQFVGILQETDDKRILFEYASEFIKSGLDISPFMLPRKNTIYEDVKRTFDGLYGVFNDSLPDGWGCLLLDRALQKKGLSLRQITPLQRLSMIGANPMGALEYEPFESLEEDVSDVELDSLSFEANKILEGESSEILDELLSLNGSSGGARPKIVANVSGDKKSIIHGNLQKVGFEPWIIKFSSSLDNKDIGAQEYIYSLIAKQAGIEMSETYLFPSKKGSGHFGIKRFDRQGNNKIHTHTACGLLHASHRFASLDYLALLKLTRALTKDLREVEKMVRLMIFNVLSGNKDDHSKNFSFMLNENNIWKMTPAYDLTPSEGINGEQTAMVNKKGKGITIEDFIEDASIVDIGADKVKEIYEQTKDALAQYGKYAKKIGIK